MVEVYSFCRAPKGPPMRSLPLESYRLSSLEHKLASHFRCRDPQRESAMAQLSTLDHLVRHEQCGRLSMSSMWLLGVR
jgi:hypothetical protein